METLTNIFESMLLKYYAMSVWFAGRKSDLYIKGAAFLFGNVLFFLTIAISVFFISLFPFRISSYILLALLLLIGHVIFYGYVKHQIVIALDRHKIPNTYNKSVGYVKKREAYLGLLLFVLSFAIMNLSFYLNFQGYLNR